VSAAQAPESGGHLRGLDALRGLAAIVVLIRHVFNAVALPADVQRVVVTSPLAPLLNAQGAVQLFFVLSGYVLARSLARGGGFLGLVQFWLKRVFRIHPPYVAGVLAALAASAFYLPAAPGSGVSPWLARALTVRPEADALLASLRFPGMAEGLLPVGWTLEVELLYSFALPLLVAAARPGRGLPLLAACTAAMLLDARFARLWFALDFALGVVAFQERHALGRRLRALPSAGRAALALAGIALFAAPLLLDWSVAARGGIVVTGARPRDIFVMALGSVVLVASAAWLPAWERVLSKPPLAFLGRISYSIYLLHLTWIHLLAPRLVSAGAPGRSFAWLLAAALAATVASSAASHRWVERPAVAAGNRACRWLAARFGAPALPSRAAGP
jgi:peptidoglycan/LPS O-acetylase OafA/YrhL